MVNQVLQVEVKKRKAALVAKLQDEMGSHFFDYTMHDVNDSLTSILALCDMSHMNDIPKVKGHIQRVNELLQNLKVYQTSNVFNVNHVLKNTISLFRKHFKKSVYLSHSFSIKRGLSSMDRQALESGMIEAMVEMSLSPMNDDDICHVNLEFCQWSKFGQIIITRKNCELPPDSRARLLELAEGFASSSEVSLKGGGTELSMLIPLHFSRDFSPVSRNLD